MCGIAGFINAKVNANTLIHQMCDAMIHRGPDAYGEYHDEQTGLWLGHRRLAIQDLTDSGAQPMISHSGRYVMVYNGEIYNARKIRELLDQRCLNQGMPSEKFRGSSDTEVILESFELLGLEETLSLMKGMFAIALYDKSEQTLVLIRDRAGEKPLYYGFIDGSFIFASDLAVLEEYPNVKRKDRISRVAIAEYMRYQYVPAPLSIYEGIYKLLPGQYMVIKAPYGEEQAEIHTYWSCEKAAVNGEKQPYDGSFTEAADKLENLLTDAIRGQMISDVPLGAFLSGGIDSPLIVSLMQKISGPSKKVKTFTIGFDEAKYNEAEFAADIARHLGTDHTELYVSEQDLLDVIPKLGEIFSEPFADSSQVPTYLVSKLAKEKVTVSLSGDAGDELFCGYNAYKSLMGVYAKSARMPKGLLKLGAGMVGASHNPKNYRLSMCLKAQNINQLHEALCYQYNYYGGHCVLNQQGQLIDEAKEWEKIRRTKGVLYHNENEPVLMDIKSNMLLKDMITYHPDDILVKVDRCGMAVSLENRVPMLDRDVMEFAWSLPIGYKDGRGITHQDRELALQGMPDDYNATKAVLRAILYKYVPRQMLDRPKKGFSVPLVRWMTEGETSKWAEELVTTSHLVKDGILDKKAVDKIVMELKSGKADAQVYWQLVMLEEWYRARFS